ncbi:LacI family transcriptional regulator [Streptacidiphilus jiangxiensis]|uniref:LacI family transcriptional regulator n=1 Tax=Streptacidiphilus jiangxiensis TaxID=235985 RepID=UPI0005AB1110|nr:LacI family transcriptional regulator [Streptacidiphilus jiangxiensis]
MQLTTVRQSIQEIGARAFEVLHSMITSAPPVTPAVGLYAVPAEASTDIVLPTRPVRRESCGCSPDPATPFWRRLV